MHGTVGDPQHRVAIVQHVSAGMQQHLRQIPVQLRVLSSSSSDRTQG